MYLNKPNMLFILIVFSLLSGCSNSKLIITSEFILNNYSKELNGFQIIQIFPKDSLMPPSNYIESREFRYSFITDNSFKWNKKIYFDKPQKGFKWVSLYKKENVEIIGKLKNDSWYLFEGLSDFGYLYFVYIDNEGTAKTYEVNKSNY